MSTALACNLAGNHTTLSFAGAALVQSNLGGQGGRCVDVTWGSGFTEQFQSWRNLCTEPQPGTVHSDMPAGRVPPSLSFHYGYKLPFCVLQIQKIFKKAKDQ